MAEDALVEEKGASKDEDSLAPKPKHAAPHLVLRILLGTAGLLLVVGFFLPWLQLGDLTNISGMQLVVADSVLVRQAINDTQRWILLVIPVLGLALTAVGFLGFRWSGIVGAIVGLLVIGYGVVTVVTIFFQTTAVGLWLILAGSFLALGVGLFAVIRARQTKPVPSKEIAIADELDA